MVYKCFMNRIITLLLLIIAARVHAQVRTDTFSFSFEGKRLSGLLDLPGNKPPGGLVILVPGSGKTNIAAESWSGLRRCFAEQGFVCLVWDKAGCGKSEGVFDNQQPVQNSAGEVVAAITEAKARHMAGSEKIGLWGISRAGWICPLVIEQIPIAFWISVSGTDDKETFGYLLEKNFLIEGRSEAQTKMLMSEWRRGIEIARTGGTFEENLKATENLRNDPFYKYMSNNGVPTKEGFLNWQKQIQAGETVIDSETDLTIYVRDFDKLLSKINCPVLAISGEKDSQVDQQKTIALYRKTIGKNPASSLTVKMLPDCNHSMFKCKTGGYREDLATWQPCTGYYNAISSWLKEKGFAN